MLARSPGDPLSGGPPKPVLLGWVSQPTRFVSCFSRPRDHRCGPASLITPGKSYMRTFSGCPTLTGFGRVGLLTTHFAISGAQLAPRPSTGPSVSVLIQGDSFPVADPHTSMFSTLTRTRVAHQLFRKSQQFRAISITRQVPTPSMPRNLCRKNSTSAKL